MNKKVRWKPEAFGQKVLPDISILLRQRLAENAKIEKFECDILGDFQTMFDNIFVSIFAYKHK